MFYLYLLPRTAAKFFGSFALASKLLEERHLCPIYPWHIVLYLYLCIYANKVHSKESGEHYFALMVYKTMLSIFLFLLCILSYSFCDVVTNKWLKLWNLVFVNLKGQNILFWDLLDMPMWIEKEKLVSDCALNFIYFLIHSAPFYL